MHKLKSHVQGMIDDLHDGLGMENSSDDVLGHPMLAAKVDAFEQSWHKTAKPNLVEHLQALRKHIGNVQDEIDEMERKLAAAAKKQREAQQHTAQNTGGSGSGSGDGGGGGGGGDDDDDPPYHNYTGDDPLYGNQKVRYTNPYAPEASDTSETTEPWDLPTPGGLGDGPWTNIKLPPGWN